MITVLVVFSMHLLGGFLLRTVSTHPFFEPDQVATTLLYIVPVIVDRPAPLPPIPEPIMRAPKPLELESPRIANPSSPLDVMAVTIPSRDISDYARDDKTVEAQHTEASEAIRRCPHANAVVRAATSPRAEPGNVFCSGEDYTRAGPNLH